MTKASRFPIRVNQTSLVRILANPIPVAEDPRPLLYPDDLPPADYSRCVSSLQIGFTWKTTSQHRQRDSDFQILEVSHPGSIILVVGASDGIDALALIQRLGPNISGYYVTDD